MFNAVFFPNEVYPQTHHAIERIHGEGFTVVQIENTGNRIGTQHIVVKPIV